MPVCSNCGGLEFVWANDLKTGLTGSGSLSLRSRGELALGTRICRSCGHADLFLKDPSVLKAPHTWRPNEFIVIQHRPVTPSPVPASAPSPPPARGEVPPHPLPPPPPEPPMLVAEPPIPPESPEPPEPPEESSEASTSGASGAAAERARATPSLAAAPAEEGSSKGRPRRKSSKSSRN